MQYQNRYYTQQGFAILETLIAFIILAVGLLVLINFNSSALQSSGDARARLEAMTLAQSKMHDLRSFLDNDTDAGSDWAARINTLAAADAETINGNNATFSRSWTVNDTGRLVDVSVNVEWQDRKNETQNYTLASEIYDVDPTEAASVLHTAILASYYESIGEGEEDDDTDPDTSQLDNDRAPDAGEWNADIDLGLTDCGAVACSSITYYYRLTISGEVDKSGGIDVDLPDPQVSTEESSGAICDFGNTSAYKKVKGTVNEITWDESTEVMDIVSVEDPDGNVTIGDLLSVEQSLAGLSVSSDGTIDAQLGSTLGDWTISFRVCSSPSCADNPVPETTTVTIELFDGSYICYAYFKELLDGDLNRDGDTDDAGEAAAADGNYGWSGILSFGLDANNAVYCFPIKDVFAPSIDDFEADTAFGQPSFDKQYEKITTNQTLFIQLATQASVCPSQL